MVSCDVSGMRIDMRNRAMHGYVLTLCTVDAQSGAELLPKQQNGPRQLPGTVHSGDYPLRARWRTVALEPYRDFASISSMRVFRFMV